MLARSNFRLSGVHSVLEDLDHLVRLGVVEDSSARDDNVATCKMKILVCEICDLRGKRNARTCIGANIDSLRTYSAIHFDVLIWEAGAQLCYLRHAAIQKFLAPASCTGVRRR